MSGRVASSLLSAVYDVIVVGGGHAGCESAAASARSGASTLLVTNAKEKIGEMSCNPSFGGIGKGHLLREVDALDGVSPRICDKSAITYQALNRGQGPAVLGLRAQIDRKEFKRHMKQEILHETKNLEVLEGSVEDLYLEAVEDGTRQRIGGVCLEDGTIIEAKAVVLTTGTFLRGEIFLGKDCWPAGRMGEKSSIGLSKTLDKLGLWLGRLRTGTPPRLLKNTIDFSKFRMMPPDEKPIPFSFMTDNLWIQPEQQLPTYIGHTTEELAQLVRDNMYENEHIRAETNGPRYCPSLEAKILKFSNTIHKIFMNFIFRPSWNTKDWTAT
ncbi:hypothetical protein L596_018506 [Steinernema carpocapsae]|uniref:MnmG N-terminal domain-containing protein n=1 Tax=Steinernema carpocapsae TaxID=34508 RepID=A0A4U5N542_STECR|nr:hypothetical protein L596_018506 [Steinernema carpocapsae]